MVDISSYVTPEEIKKNNSRIISRRKKHFIEDIRKSLEILGYAFIIYGYLLESVFQAMLANPFPAQMSEAALTKRRKQQIIKFLFYIPLTMSIYTMVIRIFMEDYANRQDQSLINGFVYGGLSLQLIGEKVCRSKLRILLNDIIILSLQFFLFALCYIETIGDNEIETDANSEIAQDTDVINSDDGDGYSGQIKVLSISPIRIIKGMWCLNPYFEESTYEDDLNIEERVNNYFNRQFNMNNSV